MILPTPYSKKNQSNLNRTISTGFRLHHLTAGSHTASNVMWGSLTITSQDEASVHPSASMYHTHFARNLLHAVTQSEHMVARSGLFSTSDAGSQYHCGWVGRGIQPPSTPHAPPPTHIPKKISKTLVFPLFDLWVTDGWTDGRTDRWMDQRTDRRMDRRRDGWTDRWTKPLIELRVRN